MRLRVALQDATDALPPQIGVACDIAQRASSSELGCPFAAIRRSARFTFHGAQEAEPAEQDLRLVRAPIRVAQEVGAGLGAGEVLLRPLSVGGSGTLSSVPPVRIEEPSRMALRRFAYDG